MRGGAGNRLAFPLISLAPLDSFPQWKPKRWARPGGRAPHHRGSASCRRAADSRPYLRYPAHGAEPVGSLSEGASCVVWRAGVVAPHKKAWYCGRVWEAAPHTNEVPCRDVHRQSPLPWKNHPPAAVPPGDGDGCMRSAGRPGHVPSAQHVEVQMVDALTRLHPPTGLSPCGDPRFSLHLLGRNESARHQGFGLRPKRLDTPDGVPRSAGPRRAGRISREARSCPVRPARGSADGGRFDRPARRCWRPPGSSPGPAPWSPWR